MSGVSDFLFGSDSSTSQYDSTRPLSDWGTNAANTFFNGATNEYNQGQGLISKGTNYLTDLYTNGTNDQVKSADSAASQIINASASKGNGAALNSMANKGIVNSSVTQNALSSIADEANNQLLAAHQQNVNNAANIGTGLLSAGTSLTTPLQQGYSTERSFQASTPLQTVQEGGSSGLLGSAAGSILGGIGSTYGTKLANSWWG
jgi:hypothetical protein